MKLKIVSDLHLEFSDVDIHNQENCDVLILAGDIMIAQSLHKNPNPGYVLSDRFRGFLSRCNERFPNVIYIAGNHEFYHGYWNNSLMHLREECAKYSNIHFMEDEIKTIGDIIFIGSTLWTDVDNESPLSQRLLSSMMNDFHLISHDGLGNTALRPAHTVERHKRSLEFVKTVVAEQHDKKFVMVGHHAPCINSIHPKYSGNSLNSGFYSELSDFILDRPQIKLWIHGHTHTVFDYMIGETRVVCNPRGYAGHEASSGWDPNFIVEI
jgi:predicted phosphodiesterase